MRKDYDSSSHDLSQYSDDFLKQECNLILKRMRENGFDATENSDDFNREDLEWLLANYCCYLQD